MDEAVNPMLPIIRTADDLLTLLDNMEHFNVYIHEYLNIPWEDVQQAKNLLHNLLNQYKKEITT